MEININPIKKTLLKIPFVWIVLFNFLKIDENMKSIIAIPPTIIGKRIGIQYLKIWARKMTLLPQFIIIGNKPNAVKNPKTKKAHAKINRYLKSLL